MLETLFGSSNYEASKLLLDINTQRHQALASNVANMDTPGYKRKDVDSSFMANLENAIRSQDINEIKRLGVAQIVEDLETPSLSSNGNNVSMDHELMQLNQNALEFQAAGQFVSGSLARLKMAIKGQSQ